jgi:hypothetical protein
MMSRPGPCSRNAGPPSADPGKSATRHRPRATGQIVRDLAYIYSIPVCPTLGTAWRS